MILRQCHYRLVQIRAGTARSHDAILFAAMAPKIKWRMFHRAIAKQMIVT